MPRSVPLDKNRHARLSFTASEDFSFTARMNAVPLFGLEAVEAAQCFPVAFLPGSLIPQAILGLGDKNEFLDDKGRWTAPYVPLYVANAPFSLASVTRADQDEKRSPVFLAIDEDAPHFKGKKGTRLFKQDGEPSEFVRRASEALGRQRRQYELTLEAMLEVEQSGVLEEKGVTVRRNDTTNVVEGLRIVNREKVMALPDETLARWTRGGIMELLFAHWRSLRHLQGLLEKTARDVPIHSVAQ